MVRYISSAFLIVTALSFSSCQDGTAKQDGGDATVPVVAEQDDWTPLFDGSSTKGWHTYGQHTVGKAWKVDNGTLHLDASNKKDWQTNDGGDIVTDEDYGNFHLKLDWKIAPNGNSGVVFFVKEDTAAYPFTWSTGLEMQVLDNEGHPDAKIHKHRAGDLYDLIASGKETVKPAGEWNHSEIISNNGNVELYLNGTNVVTTTLWDNNWKKMIAESKFSSMPAFGTFKTGKIALQDHGNDVWYRNIMIKKL
ncbi:DUF1080 domain-containing protein [Pontibacter silvestris]|uniref:DUF1080 domain-containing protein n=1 Tax=Pontibacter silvestris TaxID=2305183 RepID=A0ABW4X0F3_9BACT|nr:DUF1080 domain-containing protein [Pontibacter silvestris]MCC9135220.1 DUF1080 domain-containing protein [Pontibacter silvestris]